MPDNPGSLRRNYPLSALFVLMAACGVITALMTPVVRAVVAGSVGAPEAVFAGFLGLIAVMLLGGVVGLYHCQHGRGLLWGLLTGAVIGVVAGPVVLSPASAFSSLIAMSAGGAVVLLLVGVALRATVQE